VPAIGKGEILVRVRGCGLCGSDVAKLDPGTSPAAGLGHEIVGQAVEVGGGAIRVARDDRVVVAHHVPCAACHFCRRGSPSMCPAFKRSHLDPGGFAEYVRVPAPNVAHATFVLPDGLSDEVASFTEPLACCLRAVRRSALGPGDLALVLGLGSIGCLFAQGFAVAGARAVGWDRKPERRALARAVGVEVAESEAELGALLDAVAEGRGADCVALTAGGAEALPWALPRVRDGGALHVFAGGSGQSLPIALQDLYRRELTLTTTYSSSPRDLAWAFALLKRGDVRVDGFVTHRIPLSDLSRGVALAREQRAVKVFVIP
jgi:L-iditol 2-dehydrogenase